MTDAVEPSWHSPPPMPPVTVDPTAPGIEIRMRAERDRRGVISAPHALIRREPDGPGDSAAVIAWARPRGTRGWPWVLAVWMDQAGGSRYTSTVKSWRSGWLAFDPLLLQKAGEPHRATDYWREQRAAAIVAAVVRFGLDTSAP